MVGELNSNKFESALPEGKFQTIPSPSQLADLISSLEASLVVTASAADPSAAADTVWQTAWFLHGVASSAEGDTYSDGQRGRAHAVSAHAFDILLNCVHLDDRDRLMAVIAAQIGYWRADQVANATAVRHKLPEGAGSREHYSDSEVIYLVADLLAGDLASVKEGIDSYDRELSRLSSTSEEAADHLEGSILGPRTKTVLALKSIYWFYRTGNFDELSVARELLSQVTLGAFGDTSVDLLWVASHTSSLIDFMEDRSVWRLLPEVNPEGKRVAATFALGRRPVLGLWPPQRKLISRSSGGLTQNDLKAAMISVPTSAGKTLAAQIAVVSHLANEPTGVCYVTPLRSLGWEVEESLRDRLRYLGATVQMDFDSPIGLWGPVDSEEWRETRVHIMTPERLSGLLRQDPEAIFECFGLFIFDEVQLLSQQGGRGFLLESLLSTLRCSPARMIFLSGVMSNAKELGEWAAGKDSPVVFTEDWRAPRRIEIIAKSENIKSDGVELPTSGAMNGKVSYLQRISLAVRSAGGHTSNGYLADGASFGRTERKADGSKGKSTPAYEMAGALAVHLSKAGPVLLLLTTKKEARNAALKMSERLEINSGLASLAEEVSLHLTGDHPLVGCIKRGIAYHHAGLPSEVLRIIERAIREQRLLCVASTRTLTEGVNLPFRTVLMAPVEYEGQPDGMRMKAPDVLNAIGRAGRAGKESDGWVALFCAGSSRHADFSEFDPAPESLRVTSALAGKDGLAALELLEGFMQRGDGAILSEKLDGVASDLVKFIWHLSDLQDSKPELADRIGISAQQVDLFGLSQVDESLRSRWRNVFVWIASVYSVSPESSRSKWARTGMSLTSAVRVDAMCLEVAETLVSQKLYGEVGLIDTLLLLKENSVFELLSDLPEGESVLRVRKSPRGSDVQVDIHLVVHAWMTGSSIAQIAEAFFHEISNEEFRLETAVEFVVNGIQYYISWVLGVVVKQVNEYLLEAGSLASLQNPSAFLKYGVSSEVAAYLVSRRVASRALATRLVDRYDLEGRDVGGLRFVLERAGVESWIEGVDPTPDEILDLLRFVGEPRLGLVSDFLAGSEVRVWMDLDEGDALPMGRVVSVSLSLQGPRILVSKDPEGTMPLGRIRVEDWFSIRTIIESGLPFEAHIRGSQLRLVAIQVL